MVPRWREEGEEVEEEAGVFRWWKEEEEVEEKDEDKKAESEEA